MKYLVRAVKYCIYLAIMLALFIFVLSLLGMVGGSLDDIFVNGSKSLLQIGGILLIFAAIYPALGFGRRTAYAAGSYEELREGVVEVMHNRGYVLESEDGQKMTFRIKSPAIRLFRMFEDRITLEKNMSGFQLEGPVKDLARVVSGLENRFRQD